VSSPALRLDALPSPRDREPGVETLPVPERDSGVAASDRERLEQLVGAQFDAVWRFLRRLGVPAGVLEDAVQEVFAVTARRIGQVRPGAEKSFLFGTALRVASGVRRRTGIERSRHEPLADDAPASARNPEQLLCDRRAREALDELLAAVDEPARAVFVLFELEGFTFSEIAEALAIPRGTVASRLRRAREEFMSAARRLRGRLGDE
jgi:RNA polymerase sigma-70 factor, ECF subfamily